MTEFMPLDFTEADERNQWVIRNATYFTITWRKNVSVEVDGKRYYELRPFTFTYSNLELARKNAIWAADNVAHKPVIIYALHYPEESGEAMPLQVWVENVFPTGTRIGTVPFSKPKRKRLNE